MKVKYLGAFDAQIHWGGNNDPRPVLVIGQEYEVSKKEVHTWVTQIELVGFPDLTFNDASFEWIKEKP